MPEGEWDGAGWGILGNSLFLFLNVPVIALMGRLFLGAGVDGV